MTPAAVEADGQAPSPAAYPPLHPRTGRLQRCPKAAATSSRPRRRPGNRHPLGSVRDITHREEPTAHRNRTSPPGGVARSDEHGLVFALLFRKDDEHAGADGVFR